MSQCVNSVGQAGGALFNRQGLIYSDDSWIWKLCTFSLGSFIFGLSLVVLIFLGVAIENAFCDGFHYFNIFCIGVVFFFLLSALIFIIRHFMGWNELNQVHDDDVIQTARSFTTTSPPMIDSPRPQTNPFLTTEEQSQIEFEETQTAPEQIEQSTPQNQGYSNNVGNGVAEILRELCPKCGVYTPSGNLPSSLERTPLFNSPRQHRFEPTVNDTSNCNEVDPVPICESEEVVVGRIGVGPRNLNSAQIYAGLQNSARMIHNSPTYCDLQPNEQPDRSFFRSAACSCSQRQTETKNECPAYPNQGQRPTSSSRPGNYRRRQPAGC